MLVLALYVIAAAPIPRSFWVVSLGPAAWRLEREAVWLAVVGGLSWRFCFCAGELEKKVVRARANTATTGRLDLGFDQDTVTCPHLDVFLMGSLRGIRRLFRPVTTRRGLGTTTSDC